MKLSVCTNFEDGLIARLDKSKIGSLYGKLSSDFVGGGRSSFILPAVGKRRVERHVAEARHHGIEFDYLLNAACLGNREYSRRGNREIRSLLDWIVAIGVDSVTIAAPFLAKLVLRYHPHLKIKVSTLASVDSVEKARYWEDLGAVAIVLPHSFNRNLAAIEGFRRQLKLCLHVFANNACLHSCYDTLYHGNAIAHSSRSGEITSGYFLDYCAFNCSYQRLNNPVHFLRSDWIRPEDLDYYEKIGIDVIKIAGRSRSSDFIVRAVAAYTRRSYEGNLLDILAHPFGEKKQPRSFISELTKLLLILRQRSVSPTYVLTKLRHLPELQVNIDNRDLDGFFGHFTAGRCQAVNGGGCGQCTYCEKWAERVVRIDPEYRRNALEVFGRIVDDLVGGRIFR